MGTQGPGRKRIPNRDKMTAEDDALNQIAREAEARLAAKRAARAEAREIRMKELERQQKELFQSHKRHHGVENKWGHIEQWMEDSERYSRHSRRHASVSDDEERMSVGSRGSFRPSDYSGFLGSGSRTSSRASSARASPVVEERMEREYLEKGSRTASTLSAATLASLGGASSRRGSCDTSFSVETEASIREIKDSLAEAEEKYRRAMVSNAQLHNDKTTLMYQVETLRDELSDMEEQLWEARRHSEDNQKKFEREHQAHSILKLHFKDLTETLRQTEELLTEVSDLRLKSTIYRQEVSDLQEALQWKEKKIGALERQREISDIIRIERDRLRDEVVRLRDLLKKHELDVSPDITTNGDTDQGNVEDDVSTESSSQLAEESPHSSRESMLGKCRGSRKQPQDDMKQQHVMINKRSQSLNVIPISEHAKQAGDRRNTAEKHPDRSEAMRNKKLRYKANEKDLPKKFPTRVDDTLLLRNKEIRKQPMKDKAGAAALVPEQEFKGPTRSEIISASEMEMKMCDKKTLHVRKASNENVLKSRLVPPRPAKDMILNNKAILLSLLSAGKIHPLSDEIEKQDASGVLETEASSSDKQKCASTLDLSSLHQHKNTNMSSQERCLEQEGVPDIPASSTKEYKTRDVITLTSEISSKENKSVEMLAVNDRQGLKDSTETVLLNPESVRNKDTVGSNIWSAGSTEVERQ
ncbi:leucine-rich repeat flightless-interacting protein 2 isoform X1 [Melanotaenia boesemani]|uniref:leucine-rich repeat flightless-interacting protein 2 isoform X1 n=1 Tax=Melanotaenia boesemani TaxID=1250792 RepID=UPI001C044FF8|nr:leucine-rich repeat flightless-interacting protein 2 isoform X1 [Melanotaenia boesemani]